MIEKGVIVDTRKKDKFKTTNKRWRFADYSLHTEALRKRYFGAVYDIVQTVYSRSGLFYILPKRNWVEVPLAEIQRLTPNTRWIWWTGEAYGPFSTAEEVIQSGVMELIMVDERMKS